MNKMVEAARSADNRARLAEATAAYFQGLSASAAAEEAALQAALSDASIEVDADRS